MIGILIPIHGKNKKTMAHAVQFDSKTAWDGGKSPMNVSYGKMFMWFFLISDALTFGGLLCAYGFSRHAHADEWALAENVFTHFPFVHQHVPLEIGRAHV